MSGTIHKFNYVMGQPRNRGLSLLLGNGFSMAYDSTFGYDKLLEQAKVKFNDRILPFFEELGSDFEKVLRFYDVCLSAFPNYTGTARLLTEIREDHTLVKTGLIEAITNSHPPSSRVMTDDAKATCKGFLSNFQNVFTTNYDLLLYWVDRHDNKAQYEDDDSFCDGFLRDYDVISPKSVVFRKFLDDRRYMYNLHGALHIYTSEPGSPEKGIRKRKALQGDNLISQITDGIEEQQYPLIVSEGDPDKKLDRITNNEYLNTCFRRLKELNSDIVSYGFAFKESDGHICDAIVKNIRVRNLYVGLHGDFSDPDNIELSSRLVRMINARKKVRSTAPLEVSYYDSQSVSVWSENGKRAWVEEVRKMLAEIDIPF